LSDESVSPGCRPPTPGSHIHRVSSLLNALLVAPVGPDFPRLSSSPVRSASILQFRDCDMSLTTLFSLTEVAVVQLLARSASYPCLFAGLRQCPLAATYPAPGSYTVVLVSLLVFPRVRFSVPRLELSSHESTSRVGHYAIFGLAAGRHPLVCMLPLSLSPLRAS